VSGSGNGGRDRDGEEQDTTEWVKAGWRHGTPTAGAPRRDAGERRLRLRHDAAGTLRVQAARQRRQDAGGLPAEPPGRRGPAATRAALVHVLGVRARSCGLGDLVVKRLVHPVLPF
jgi:hypothetical protein